MLVLGIDSTAVIASVAIAEIDKTVRTYSVFSVKNRLTHSENLLPMIKQALDIYGAKTSDIGLFAVAAGPGSFTGVRIGVSTIKGLAFAFDGKIPCACVSSLESLAENISHTKGIVCPVMDARRNQFYNALFLDGKRLCEDRIITASELSDTLDEYKDTITLCGDGADLFASLYKGASEIRVTSPASKDQNALSVAFCGYKMYCENRTVSAKELKPIYLRASQAERERLGQSE